MNASEHIIGARQQHIAHRFDAAAASYDAHSSAQRHAAAQLAAQIAALDLPAAARVLEIGCGTGHLSTLLRADLPHAELLLTDIAPAMLAACAGRLAGQGGVRFAPMDARTPDQPGPFDLIAGSLVAQWFDDLPAVVQALGQRLAPGGVLALSLLGPATFAEWQDAHTRLGLRAGSLPLRAEAGYRAAFPAGGELRLTRELWHDRPADGLAFLRGLRAIGADTPAPGHRPLSAGQLRAVLRALGPQPTIGYELFYALWRAPCGAAGASTDESDRSAT